MTSLCAFVDDVLDEAAALANQLQRQGVPFEIRPVMPRDTTVETYRLITAAKPKAAMIDYYLSARPGTKSEDLACRLLHHRIPTVVVTKDRNMADRGPIRCNGQVIPVYFKQQLINDLGYVKQLVTNLGGRAILPDETDPTERLQFLQEKVLHSALLRKERSELRTLLARLELEEDEEAARIEGAQVKMKENLDSLIGLIREVTTGLNEELKAKNAVSTGKKRS